MIDKLFRWADERLNISGGTRKLVNKIFPDHWSFMLGEIALYSFIVLVATGVFLTLYFVPSQQQIVYHGAYLPLVGQKVSEAYASTINLSFAVRAGLLMRQMHHWAANIFVGSIVVHMARVFFTGGYRRPRELNWIIGVNLLILAIFNGFLGYSLPDDLVSGTGIRIAFSILESVPGGSYIATFLFGGNFPGTLIISRFYIIHVLILPAIIAVLIGAHLGLLVKQKHTQFAGNGATEKNVVGAPMWPTFLAKTNGFLFLVAGVTALLAATVQINPIWQYGPYVPYKVSYAVQPDWYMGWLDGALRVMPSWEIVFPGHMIPNVFFPGILLPGITFTALMFWPMIEARIRKDHLEHHILDEPRNNPWRTALGAAVFSFYFVLFGASADDVLANYLNVSLNIVLVTFRVLVFAVPAIVYPLTYKICLELQHQHRPTKTKRHNIVMRSPDGGYSTVEVKPRPGDERLVLPPLPLDAMVLVTEDGVSAEMAADGGPPSNGHDAKKGRGIFRVPRTYH
ncbi:MAG: cytochrome bc1 complex cytochrome b subunit [Acidimicrobiales bacterium]